MTETYKLTVVADVTNLRVIADFMIKVAVAAGFDDSATYEVQMAVDEACSNVIEHAYQGEDQGDITLTCKCEAKEWIILIYDQGRAFDPSSVPEPNLNPNLDEIRTGGLGLYFMRQLMDEVEFSFDESKGNKLRMVKKGV